MFQERIGMFSGLTDLKSTSVEMEIEMFFEEL